MGGLYDILESYRLQGPKFTYEGLYQDPRRDDTTYYNGDLKTHPYGLTDPANRNFQAFKSSAFPQDYGVGSLFNPRVGRPEQSIYYNEPEPADPTSDFYQPLPGFINAPQNYYTPVQNIPSVPVQDFQFLKSAYEDDDEEQVEYLPGQEPKGIAKLFQKIGDIYSSLPTPMNILRGGLQGIQSLNQKLRGTTFGMSPTLKDYFQAKKAEKKAAAGADVGVGGEGRGSRRGDADISSSQRGGFATDDTAGFF
jgi:hypothetical protein